MIALAVGVGFALFAASQTRGAAAQPRICFFVDSPHLRIGKHAAYGTGHAFVQLIPDANDKTSPRNKVYGHGAGTGWPLTSNGETSDDSDHPWDWKICYDVTPEQYDKAAGFIRGEQANPSEYHLFGLNCTNWVDKIAELIGVTLPRKYELGETGKIEDPSVLEDNLKKIGDGGKFHGGTVHMNNKDHPVSPKDTRDPQPAHADVCSIDGLIKIDEGAPRQLAKGLGFKTLIIRGPTRHVGTREPVTIRIVPHHFSLELGPPPWLDSRALVAIDWGDGSRTLMQLTGQHTYGKPGTYKASVVVIDDGDVVLGLYSWVAKAGGVRASQVVPLPKPAAPKTFPPPPPGPCPDNLIGPSACGVHTTTTTSTTSHTSSSSTTSTTSTTTKPNCSASMTAGNPGPPPMYSYVWSCNQSTTGFAITLPNNRSFQGSPPPPANYNCGVTSTGGGSNNVLACNRTSGSTGPEQQVNGQVATNQTLSPNTAQLTVFPQNASFTFSGP
jgi:hypothetical protein